MPFSAELLATHLGFSCKLVLSDRLADLVDEDINVAVRIGVLEEGGLVATRLGSVADG